VSGEAEIFIGDDIGEPVAGSDIPGEDGTDAESDEAPDAVLAASSI